MAAALRLQEPQDQPRMADALARGVLMGDLRRARAHLASLPEQHPDRAVIQAQVERLTSDLQGVR